MNIRENTAKKVVDKRDGSISWEVEIWFDVTEEGIVFGTRRNYNPSFIRKLIESKSTQQAIKGGYAVVMYGHLSREDKYSQFAVETHPKTGLPQLPLGRVTHISIDGNIIHEKMVILETKDNFGSTIAQYLKHGIGGFSTVFSVSNRKQEGMLKGIDFVLARNFANNQVHRVLIDSICSVDGSCSTTPEDLIENQAREIVGSHVELLDTTIQLLTNDAELQKYAEIKNRITSSEREATIQLNRFAESQKALEESQRELSLAHTKIEELLGKIDLIEKENEDYERTIETLEYQVNNFTRKAKKAKKKAKRNIEKELKEQGLQVGKEGKILVDSLVYKKIFMDDLVSKETQKEVNIASLIRAKQIAKKSPILNTNKISNFFDVRI